MTTWEGVWLACQGPLKSSEISKAIAEEMSKITKIGTAVITILNQRGQLVQNHIKTSPTGKAKTKAKAVMRFLVPSEKLTVILLLGIKLASHKLDRLSIKI